MMLSVRHLSFLCCLKKCITIIVTLSDEIHHCSDGWSSASEWGGNTYKETKGEKVKEEKKREKEEEEESVKEECVTE